MQFRPEYCCTALKVCSMGGDDIDVADALGVSYATVRKWKCEFPQFNDSCLEGIHQAKRAVKKSLLQKATGYRMPAVKFMKNGDGAIEEISYIEHHAPDTAAIKFWLINHCPDEYAEKSSSEVTGKNGKDLMPAPIDPANMSDELLDMLEKHMGNEDA